MCSATIQRRTARLDGALTAFNSPATSAVRCDLPDTSRGDGDVLHSSERCADARQRHVAPVRACRSAPQAAEASGQRAAPSEWIVHVARPAVKSGIDRWRISRDAVLLEGGSVDCHVDEAHACSCARMSSDGSKWPRLRKRGRQRPARTVALRVVGAGKCPCKSHAFVCIIACLLKAHTVLSCVHACAHLPRHCCSDGPMRPACPQFVSVKSWAVALERAR